MKPVVDSFWRAAAYCLLPRVIGLTLLPLLVMSLAALGIGYFGWRPALAALQSGLSSWWILSSLDGWLAGMGMDGVLAPLLLVLFATPLMVLVALLVVATAVVPALVRLVEQRRFPGLQRLRGGSFVAGAFGAVGASLLAVLVLLLSVPLWFIPPLVLIVPPLIWGWLTYRVMSYDVLAEHASAAEREQLMRSHRSSLLLMGIICGYLGAAPSVVWASALLFIALAPLLVPLAIWIYTFVFAFSALWFTHYALAALEALRAADTPRTGAVPPVRMASNPVLPVAPST